MNARNKTFTWAAGALLALGLTASCVATITPNSAPEQRQPIPTPTWPAPSDVSYRFPDCADVISERTTNMPGYDSTGDFVMCNPDLTDFYDTTPDSFFDNDTLRVYEDGSLNVMISRRYREGDDFITVSNLASYCAIPILGCTPDNR